MKHKKITIIVVSLLVISLIFNIIIIIKFYDIYKTNKKLRLDPLELENYKEENKSLKKNTGKKRIILYGDSRIKQWHFTPENINSEVINRGIVGQTTSQVLLRINEDVLQLKPDRVIIQVGINDLNTIGLFPDKKNKIIEKSKKNLKNIINKLIKNKIEVVVLSIFPLGRVPLFRKPIWKNEILKARNEVNQYLRSLKNNNFTFVNCDKIFMDNQVNDQFINEKYSIDLAHINKIGYARLNNYIKKYFE